MSERIRLGRISDLMGDSAREAEERILKQNPKELNMVPTGLVLQQRNFLGTTVGVWGAAAVALEGFWLLKNASVYTTSTNPQTCQIYLYRVGSDYWTPIASGEESLYSPVVFSGNYLLEGDWRVYARCLRSDTVSMYVQVLAEKLTPGRGDN